MSSNSKATLIGETIGGERILATAAKMSRTKGTTSEVFNTLINGDDNKKTIEIVKNLGHTSFLEHLYLNFAIDNATKMAEQFMIEFRLTSFTVKSARYVDYRTAGYYVPSIFIKGNKDYNPELEAKYKNHMDSLFSKYKLFVDNGVPVEDARCVLPYCYRSNFVFSANAREVIHMLYSMLYGEGSKYEEIYNIGKQMHEQLITKYPTVFNNIEKIERLKEEKKDKISLLINKENKIKDKAVKSKVELISSTPDKEKIIIEAMMIKQGIYDSKYVDEIIKNKELKNNLFNILIKDLKRRELEQISFTFKLSNISLGNLAHLTRHRIQSLIVPNIMTASADNNYVIPDTIAKNKKLESLYIESFKENRKIYQYFISQGIAKEKLVSCSLAGNVVTVYTTINARELMTIFALRTCDRAQWEIREFATLMLLKVYKELPLVFDKAGPLCYTNGKCPEGKDSCGKPKTFDQLLKK